MATSYEVCVYIVYNHQAFSFGDRPGHMLQSPIGDLWKSQSSCNLHDHRTEIVGCPCDVLAGSLRLSQEPTIIFPPHDYLKSSDMCDASTGIVRSW